MKIVIREKAAADPEAIYAWIARDNPRAATATVQRIRARIGRLGAPGFAHIGRPGKVTGTRELVEAPYIIVYRVNDEHDELVLLAIFHGAQNRYGS
jgi:toxin ParE1/3/4